jgi:hypothetical protein
MDGFPRIEMPPAALPTRRLQEHALLDRVAEPIAALDTQTVDLVLGLAEAFPWAVNTERVLVGDGAAEAETDCLMADELKLAHFAAGDEADLATLALG